MYSNKALCGKTETQKLHKAKKKNPSMPVNLFFKAKKTEESRELQELKSGGNLNAKRSQGKNKAVCRSGSIKWVLGLQKPVHRETTHGGLKQSVCSDFTGADGSIMSWDSTVKRYKIHSWRHFYKQNKEQQRAGHHRIKQLKP